MSKELFEDQRQFEASNKPQYTLEGMLHYLRDLTESVENGNSDSIVTLAKITNLEKALKDCKDQVYLTALEEAEKYPEKTFEHKGVKVEKRAGRKVYDFKNIQEWNNLNQNVKLFESKSKAAYDAYQKGLKMYDEETGEEIPIPSVYNTKDVLVLRYAD
ncbi:hypothetical protein EP331_00320 [bacterium]|nr:MAG: hypothetical protein EP331_00320 [bacterium]